jgi:hypothetical protein
MPYRFPPRAPPQRKKRAGRPCGTKARRRSLSALNSNKHRPSLAPPPLGSRQSYPFYLNNTASKCVFRPKIWGVPRRRRASRSGPFGMGPREPRSATLYPQKPPAAPPRGPIALIASKDVKFPRVDSPGLTGPFAARPSNDGPGLPGSPSPRLCPSAPTLGPVQFQGRSIRPDPAQPPGTSRYSFRAVEVQNRRQPPEAGASRRRPAPAAPVALRVDLQVDGRHQLATRVDFQVDAWWIPSRSQHASTSKSTAATNSQRASTSKSTHVREPRYNCNCLLNRKTTK